MYDFIIVGARVAGAATAIQLGRRGYRVLLVDKGHFPSDTISSHQIQVTGVAVLNRLKLLEKVLLTDVPLVQEVSYTMAGVRIEGRCPTFDGVDAFCCARRFELDALLVAEAAQIRTVEVIERCDVRDMIYEAGKVVGIRAQTRGGPVTAHATVVIGADGRRSRVASLVGATAYTYTAPMTCAYYAYFADVECRAMESNVLENDAFGMFPTNHGLTGFFHSCPITEFARYKANVEQAFWSAVEKVPLIHERLRAGRPVQRIKGTAFLPNYKTLSYGPGWALVGDSATCKDPITGYGIGDALRSSELLVRALDAAMSGEQELGSALAQYQRERDDMLDDAYQLTLQTASFKPTLGPRLMATIADDRELTESFVGVLCGVVPPRTLASSLSARARRVQVQRQPRL